MSFKGKVGGGLGVFFVIAVVGSGCSDTLQGKPKGENMDFSDAMIHNTFKQFPKKTARVLMAIYEGLSEANDCYDEGGTDAEIRACLDR